MRRVFENPNIAHFICAASLVFIFGAYNVVFAELIPVRSCSITPSTSCEILNITINPCPEVDSGQPCNYYRGTNVTLTMFYKPNFNATKLKIGRYSRVLGVDVFDPTYFHRDAACNFTSCPITAGETYKFEQSMKVLQIYPQGVYTAIWKIWNENDEECCFQSTAAVV